MALEPDPRSSQPGEPATQIPKQTLRLSPGGAGVQLLRDQYLASLRLLMWISALVLAIACANVANLMLVRATTRRFQTSILMAASAAAAPRRRPPSRVDRRSSLGVAIAYGGTSLILRLAFQNTYVAHPRFSVSTRARFHVCGIPPDRTSLRALLRHGSQPEPLPPMPLRGAGRSSGRGGWTQKTLVVAQAALSFALLSAAAPLLALSLRNMQTQHFGFETPNRYIMHIEPQMAGYKPAQMQPLFQKLHESLAAIPGVAQVGFSLYTPMEGDNWGEHVFIDGQAPPPPDSDETLTSWLRVSSSYFETMGTKIVQGRPFTEQDSATSLPVAVVNRTFARRFFKGDSALGKHFGFDIDLKKFGDFEIIGVTEDTKYRDPAKETPPMFFLPSTQSVTFDDPRGVAFDERIARPKRRGVEYFRQGAEPRSGCAPAHSPR